MLVDCPCHAAAVVDSVLLIALSRTTSLNIQMVFGGNLAQSPRNPLFLPFRNRQQFRLMQLLIPHHETEKATVNVWCKPPGHIVESFEMLFYGVFVGQQDRGVPPDDFLLTDQCRQFF